MKPRSSSNTTVKGSMGRLRLNSRSQQSLGTRRDSGSVLTRGRTALDRGMRRPAGAVGGAKDALEDAENDDDVLEGAEKKLSSTVTSSAKNSTKNSTKAVRSAAGGIRRAAGRTTDPQKSGASLTRRGRAAAGATKGAPGRGGPRRSGAAGAPLGRKGSVSTKGGLAAAKRRAAKRKAAKIAQKKARKKAQKLGASMGLPTSPLGAVRGGSRAGRLAVRSVQAVVHTVQAITAGVRAIIALATTVASTPVLIAVLALLVILGLIIAILSILPGVGEEAAREDACVGPSSGQALTVTTAANGEPLPLVPGYTPQQVGVAAAIMQAAEAQGLDSRAQLIGLITADQESTMGVNTQPTGVGDAGPFQQRTLDGWYGSPEQVQDTTYAATAFFKGVTAKSAGDYGSAGGGSGYGHIPGLVDIDGWESMTPGEAAQAVQRSDFPDAYQDNVAGAQTLMTALSGVDVAINPAGAGCGVGITATGDVKTALERGQGLIGTPYEFGGGGVNGPDTGIDCSGFVQYMLAAVGITDLPRTAQGQFDALSGSPVDPADIQPGDLIFYAKGRTGTVGSPDAISHVAMYAGEGQMIESTRYNGGTEPGVQKVAAKVEDGYGFVGVRRVPGLTNGTETN